MAFFFFLLSFFFFLFKKTMPLKEVNSIKGFLYIAFAYQLKQRLKEPSLKTKQSKTK